MSAALVLPCIWAYACPPGQFPYLTADEADLPDLYFAYRPYTEALLRRYVTMSMEAGRAPSFLGKELFRGKVTNCRVEGFDDVVMADLSVLKSQMKEILGNGQPGRLSQLEGRIFDHERTMQRMKGIAAAFGGLLTFAHVAIDLLVGRR